VSKLMKDILLNRHTMLNIQHVIKVSVLEACPNMVIKLASYNSVSTEFTFPRGENELNSIVG